MQLYLDLAMKTKSDEKKRSAFLYLISTEGREIFNTFNLDEQKLQNLIDAFDNYCKPKENITAERYKFNSRNQTRTETFDQYVTDLKYLAKNCKFRNLQDELIRDKIVCGIANEKIKERLLREDKLTLDKAIDICRAAEESQKHVKMFETDVNLAVNKIKKNRGLDNAQRRKHAVNQPEARPTTYPQARSKTNQCPRCGYEHPPRSCPAYGKTCGACGKQNHFKSQCQTKTGGRPTHQKQPHKNPKQKVHNVHEDDDSETESDMDNKHFFVAAIGQKGKENCDPK
ncbi:polyprotein [Plakobranchus ocellatus]|uniref:Polyprotein n=1 Tax=Plakobranchus ocellatus TaxID=259542 RepID=A0AAV4BEX7_9GAST|nr:polyprotein [Plakobranchus ocellatus]